MNKQFENKRLQIENLKKELEQSYESYNKLKKITEEQMISLTAKEKVNSSFNLYHSIVVSCSNSFF